MTTQTMTRQQEIHAIWKDYQGLYVMAGVLIGLLVFPFLELVINDLSQLLIGIVPEAIGIGFTVSILDREYQKREEKRKIEDNKHRLIRDVGSQVEGSAVKAVEELRAHDWLEGDDGLLKGASLVFAKLQGLNLEHANFEEIDLLNANLEEANLQYAELKKAYLREANMKGTNLIGANLEGANLNGTNLEGAIMWHANLSGAKLVNANLSSAKLASVNLSGANLHNANLEGAILTRASLPDGTIWTSKDDMRRFIDREHPEYEATIQKVTSKLREYDTNSSSGKQNLKST